MTTYIHSFLELRKLVVHFFLLFGLAAARAGCNILEYTDRTRLKGYRE